MGSLDDKNEPEWITRVKSEGAVPLLEPDNCSNGWTSPPGDKFMVRGPDYFSTKVKVPAGDYLLKPIGFDWIKGPTKIWEVLRHSNNRIRKVLDDAFPAGDKPFIWAFNLQVPSKDNFSAVAYFTFTEPIVEGSLMDQFLKGDDVFRNSRLKMIANIVKGPWIVKKAVGEQAICRRRSRRMDRYYRGDPGVPHTDPARFVNTWVGSFFFSAVTWINPLTSQLSNQINNKINSHDKAMLREQKHWKKAFEKMPRNKHKLKQNMDKE